jgi:hypothetical protein
VSGTHLGPATNFSPSFFNYSYTFKDFNPCLVHPVALAINKKNEPPLFANTVANKGGSFFLFKDLLMWGALSEEKSDP